MSSRPATRRILHRRFAALSLAMGAAVMAGATNTGIVAHAGTAHLVLSPSSSTITAVEHQVYTAHFINAFGNDLGDVTALTVFTLDDLTGSCTLASCTETKPGIHTVTGTDGVASGTASLTVTVGPLDHLVITPNPDTITSGDPSVAYKAEGFDAVGNDLGDVTASTTFSISPDGSCSTNSCGATTAGTHTVTGNDGGKTGTATLHVLPGSLDHLVLSPASATITAGDGQPYSAEGFDAHGNDLGNVTALTAFTVDGHPCTGDVCSPTAAGDHTVTGTDAGKTGTASLHVDAGPLARLSLSPGSTFIPVGGSQAYTAEGFDSADNDLGDVTAHTTFTISPTGSCTGATCTASSIGPHTVTGTDGIATGTATLDAEAIASLTLSPASATIAAGGHQAYTAEAFDAHHHDLGDVTSGTTFTIDDPLGSCTGATCTAQTAGGRTVTGTDGVTSGTASLTVAGAALDHLVLHPAIATILAGGSQPYTAEGFDTFGNDLGDVTAGTTFTIDDPRGSCTGSTCTAQTAGDRTVTGTDGTAHGTSSLTVIAGPLDHLVLSPSSASITAGDSQPYTAEGFDQYGNDLGDHTALTTFAIDDANGSCTGASCMGVTAGAHTVTGTDDLSSAHGTASLTVTAGTLTNITLSPDPSTIPVGGHQTYTAEGFDAFHNDLGDVTADTTLAITPTGSCTGATCIATSVGDHTVTGTDGAAAYHAVLHVIAIDHLTVSPASSSIAAGGHQAYSAEAFDASNKDLGDVTSGSAFTIGPNGSCTGASCTATTKGDHTVTAHDDGATATATLTVTPATVTTLTLAPATKTIAAGGSQAYTAEGFDTYGNDAGDVTASTTFTIDDPHGSCSAATCTGTTAGPHTVTGTDGGATDTASLTVTAGPLDHLVLSPTSATINAGDSQVYTAEGFDQYGNDLGDETASTIFGLDDGTGSCTLASCTETKAGHHTVTGDDDSALGTAALTVDPGPLAALTLSPADATIPVGGHQAYTAEGFDHFGNDRGDVTASTTFAITPAGSCTGSTCTATSGGTHTVTGTDSGVLGTATLHVGLVDHLVLSPAGASIAAGGHQAYTAEAFDSSNHDLGDVTSGTTFTIAHDGSCTGATCTATVAGDHTVTGTDSSANGSTGLTVTHGPVTTLTLAPADRTIAAGGSQAYTAEGSDTYGNDAGDVTAATTFGITPDGSCTAATCTATSAGRHTVTGTDGGAGGSTGLTITPGPLDHLTLSPASASVTAGTGEPYTAEGLDQYGNDLGDETAATTFGLDDPSGSCIASTCTESTAGQHVVTGTDGSAIGTAALTVTPGPAASLTLSPATAFMIPGDHRSYTAEGFDSFGNDTGDVTASTVFTITPDGSCTGSTCTASAVGPHTVTGTDTPATGTATLTVATLEHLGLSPSSATITAGGHQSYTAEGFDASNDDLGDMTGSTTFSITPDGTCSGTTCAVTAAGPHTVTGTDGAATGTASLTVDPGPLHDLVLSPAGATITAGDAQPYTAEGFDQYGNDLGDETGSTTFAITPNGSCTAATCTATTAGAHTVTGTDGSATGTTGLTVDPGALDHLVLSPAGASITAGDSQGYTAEGFDQYGNDLGDETGSTTFALTPDGSCTSASCTATTAGAHTVTGTDGAATGTTSLTVNSGPLDHLTLSPASARIVTGAHQAYTAEGVDQFGNDLGDETPSTTFTIAPDGSCSRADCTALITGDHTVTGSDGGPSGTADLMVTSAADTITVTPHSHALRANGTSHTPVTATVVGSDGHPVVGATVSFTSYPDASNANPGGPLTLSPASAVTDASGVASTTATSSTHAGYVIISAADGNGSGTAQEHLTATRFVATSLARSSVPADGSSTTTATATAVDGSGNPVPGDTVTFANDGSSTGPSVSQPSAVTDSNGTASAQVTSSTYGGAQTITVTDSTSDVPGDQFSSPLTLTQTATNASFIHAAYQTMLGHDADPSGFSYWLGRLDAGTPRSVLALSLATTAEYRTNVIGGSVASGVPDFYELYLDRPADPGGIAYWVDRMAGIGGPAISFEQVRLRFVGSSEYFNVTNGGDPATIIEALYNDLLGRASDPDGKSYWLTHFDVNTIASQFLFSTEGRQVLVESYYASILHRSFDQSGLDYWTQRLLSGASDEDIIADFLSSDEYFQSH